MTLEVDVCYFKNGDICASRNCKRCSVTEERKKTKGILSFDLGGEAFNSSQKNVNVK